MNKYIKLIPSALLTCALLASCSGGKTTYVNALDEFVCKLADGEVSKGTVEGIYAEAIFGASDKSVTYSTYDVKDYSPYWMYGSGQEEEVYEQYVHNLKESLAYRRYSNNVVVTSSRYSNYPYDKDLVVDDDSEGISLVPETYNDEAHIYEKDGNAIYTYIRNKDKKDAYSFSHKQVSSEALMATFLEGGGLSEDIAGSVSQVEENFAYYKGIVGEGFTIEESFSAVKEGQKLTVTFRGDLNYPLYSAERYWGWTYAPEDTEYKNPLVHDTTDFDGFYVKMGIRLSYHFVVNKGFITDAQAVHMSYYRELMKDKNWKSGDPVPEVDLSEEYIAGLDLYTPDTIKIDGKEITNPYKGTGYMDTLPYTVEDFSTSHAVLDDYKESKIPDTTEMREADVTDIGVWFDVRDMIEFEE